MKSFITCLSMITIAMIWNPALLPGRLIDSRSVTAARSQTVEQPVCIGFDRFPDGSDVTTTAQTTREITTQYGSLGVKFSAGTSQKFVAVRDGILQRAVSPPNTARAQGSFSAAATMTAEFFDPATGAPATTSFASITTAKVKGSGTLRDFQAFDFTGAEATSAQVAFAETQQGVSLSAYAPGIRKVTLDMSSSDFFDDFCFGFLRRFIVVDTTSDAANGNMSSLTALISNKGADGKISLREAITAANNTPGTDRILFNIPKSDRGYIAKVWTITLLSPLPPLTDDSGITIDGRSQMVAQGNTNLAGPEVAVSGKSAGSADGFRIISDGNTIHSLTITGFSGNGIVIAGGAYNRIGPLNVIMGNQGAGIVVMGETATSNRLCGNSIYDNGGLGIDLGADGVTLGGLGKGPNLLMSQPEIILAETYKVRMPDGTWSYSTIVQGRIDAANAGSMTINVFFNDKADPSGCGEGKTYAGATVPDATGEWALTIPGYSGPYITATAMDANGNTSEFCYAKQVVEKIGGIGVISSGETWMIGSTVTIRWVSSGITDPVKIEMLSPTVSSQDAPELRDMSVSEYLRLVCQMCGPPPPATQLASAADPRISSPLGEPEWWDFVSPRQETIQEDTWWDFDVLLQETIIERAANDGSERWMVLGVRVRPGILAAVRITPSQLKDKWVVLGVSPDWIALSPPAPDLVVQNLQVNPATIRAGSGADVTFDIVNQGSASADPATHEIWLLAKRESPTGLPGQQVPVTVRLATVTTGPLAAGASQSFRVTVTIPQDIAAGAGLIQIIGDAGSAVNESDEFNNTVVVPIMITR